MAKVKGSIPLEELAGTLCEILWTQIELEGTDSIMTLEIMHRGLTPIVCNGKWSYARCEALALVGAIPPLTGRRTDFKTISSVDMEVVWKYLMDHRSELPPLDPELFDKPTKEEKNLMIQELGAVYTKVATPNMDEALYSLFAGGTQVIYADYDTLVVDESSKLAESSIVDRLEAYMIQNQFDYTDLYSLFPYEVRTDSEGGKYAHGVMLRCSQGGEEVLESVGLLLTSTIREDLRQSIGQGFLKLATMYGNVARRRKYSSVLLLEQLIKAPEVYVVSMHGGIKKICTFLLEDPDVGPEVIARIKKRIRD
jgi:hypothetical protein